MPCSFSGLCDSAQGNDNKHWVLVWVLFLVFFSSFLLAGPSHQGRARGSSPRAVLRLLPTGAPGGPGDQGSGDRGDRGTQGPSPRSRRAAAAPCPSPPRLVAFALATSGGGGGGDGSSLFPPGPRFTGRSPRSEGLLARSWASTLGCAVRAGARSGICRSCSPLALPYAAPVLQILAESPSIRGARIKDEEARGGERGMCVMP